MGTKIFFTGLLLLPLWTVPAIMKDSDPPDWVKVAILVLAFVGTAMCLVGALMAIWA